MKWKLYDDNGVLLTDVYFVSDAKVCLFSVQQFLGTNQGSFHLEGEGASYLFLNRGHLSFKKIDTTTGKC